MNKIQQTALVIALAALTYTGVAGATRLRDKEPELNPKIYQANVGFSENVRTNGVRNTLLSGNGEMQNSVDTYMQTPEAADSHAVEKLIDAEALVQVYDAMRNAGYLGANSVKNPENETLINTYQYAIEQGHIDPENRNLQADIEYLESKKFPTKGPIATTKSSAACKVSGVSCAISATASILSCSAIPESGGALTEVCIKALLASTVACAGVATNCGGGLPVADYTSATRGDGSSNAVVKDIYCGDNGHVYQTQIFWGQPNVTGVGVRIRGIKLWCTNGDYRYVEQGRYAGQSSKLTTCATGRLIQGFDVRSGSHIDALAARCDKVWHTDSEYRDNVATMAGGTGGDLSTLKCTEGHYVTGLRVWANKVTQDNIGLEQRFIKAFALICHGPN